MDNRRAQLASARRDRKKNNKSKNPKGTTLEHEITVVFLFFSLTEPLVYNSIAVGASPSLTIQRGSGGGMDGMQIKKPLLFSFPWFDIFFRKSFFPSSFPQPKRTRSVRMRESPVSWKLDHRSLVERKRDTLSLASFHHQAHPLVRRP